MNAPNAVCNYALLRFIPHPQTGEVVNVGVAVSCIQPCFLHFFAEKAMPARVKALFPKYDPEAFAWAVAAMNKEVKRIQGKIQVPKDCQHFFSELVRPRESTFRFGEVRTVVTKNPQSISNDLFKRYVRMESTTPTPVAG